MGRITAKARAVFLLGLRRGLARVRAERERLTDQLEDAIEKIDAERAVVRAELGRWHTLDDVFR